MIGSILAGAASGLLVSTLFAFLWRRRLEKKSQADSIIARIRKEVENLLTELNGTTERNVALLEHRLGDLNMQLERAEKAVGVLKRETEKRDLSQDVYTALGRNRVVPFREDPSPSIPEAHVTKIGEDEVEQTTEESVEPSREEDVPVELSIRERVLALHRQGKSPEKISTDLDLSRGEIELIISLHDRRS